MPAMDVALGHLAFPDAGVHPGVVMIHDVWGVSDHTRDMAGRLAAEGFAVLAVDLYHRKDEVRIEDPGAWMRGLSDVEALADVQAAVDLLAAHPATGGGRVGVTGFCMGGMVALLAACACRGLSASAPYYGLLSHAHGLLYDPAGLDPQRKPRPPLEAVADLGCPLLAFFGDRDDFIPPEDVDALRQRLAATSLESEVVVYAGAGHAFMNDARPAAYREDAARDAWARMLTFFRMHLDG